MLSAQRLPASEVFSPFISIGSRLSIMCSTPSGIRGLFTRHGMVGPLHKTGAQRLPASEVFSPDTVVPSVPET